MNTSVSSMMARVVLTLAIVFLIGMGVFSKRGWLDWRRMVQQNIEIQTKVAQAQAQKELLERRIAALQSDAEQQEVIIRQTLGYVRPQETVIEFQ